MNLRNRSAAVPPLLLAALLAFATAAVAADELPETSPDGLQLVKRKDLRVTAGIIDLYITAPDTNSVSPQSRSFAFSAGQMTLVGELRDSESGAILARVADRKGGQDSTRMTWATSTSNRAEARRALAQWAGILRDALDRAKSS